MPPPSSSLLSPLLSSSSPPPPSLSSSSLLSLSGDSHFYQVRTTFLLALQWTIVAFILQGQPFLFLAPKFRCKVENRVDSLKNFNSLNLRTLKEIKNDHALKNLTDFSNFQPKENENVDLNNIYLNEQKLIKENGFLPKYVGTIEEFSNTKGENSNINFETPQDQEFLNTFSYFDSNGETFSYYQCEEEEACKSLNREIWPGSSESLTVSFNLYCERGYLKSLCQTLFFIASNINTLIFSFLADLKGRKIAILILYILGAIPLLVASFAGSWILFMILLIISGAGVNPYSGLCFVLLSESSGERFRQSASVALLMTWGIGQLLFIPIAYYFRDWNVLLLYWIAIPLTIQIVSYIWIYESPKFLVSKKRFSEAKEVFKKIAATNKKSLPDFKFKEEAENELPHEPKPKQNTEVNNKNNTVGINPIVSVATSENISNSFLNTNQNELPKKSKTQNSEKIYTYLDLWRYPSQRKITFILSLAYFALYICYYGGIFAMETLGGNIYISAILLNSSELIAYILSEIIVRKTSRKHSFATCLFIMAFSCFLFLASENYIFSVILAMVAKFSVSISFSIIYIYTAELYPTPVRSLGIGLSTFLGKFGCALAPVLINFCKGWNVNAMVSFGIFAAVAGIGVGLGLEETKEKGLKEKIKEEEGEEEGEKEKMEREEEEREGKEGENSCVKGEETENVMSDIDTTWKKSEDLE